MTTETVPVALAGRSYDVRVGSGLLADIAAQCGPLLRKQAVPIVTDSAHTSGPRSTRSTNEKGAEAVVDRVCASGGHCG